MSPGDDVREGLFSSYACKSLESNHAKDSISAEDVAWADSCLINDLDIAESEWDSLKDALLEILHSQPEALGSSEPRNNNPSGETARMTNHSRDESEDGIDLILMNGEEVEMKIEIPVDDGTASTSSQTCSKSPFLPNYKDELNVIEAADPASDLEFPASEMEPSGENIFRVWDLGIQAEEDLFDGKLGKALEDGLRPTPSTLDAAETWTDLNDEPLHGLIAGMADLSLSRDSDRVPRH